MNAVQLFIGSFHSAAAYRYMRAKASFGMGYALFVVALVTLFVTLYYGMMIYSAAFMAHGDKPALFDSVMRDMGKQAPVMTLKDDTLATKDPIKTVIHARGELQGDAFDVPFITIDTSGQSTTGNTNTTMLVTDKNLFIKSGQKWESQPLSDFTKNGPSTILINHAVAEEMVENFITYIHGNLIQYYIVIWLISMVCLYVVSYFILLTLGLVGLVLASMLKTPLSFGASVGLASLAFTPVAVLDAALLTFFGYAAHIITLLVAGSVTLYAGIRCSDPQPVTPRASA